MAEAWTARASWCGKPDMCEEDTRPKVHQCVRCMRLLLLAAAVCGPGVVAAYSWPQFGASATHGSLATVTGSQTGAIRWKTPLGGGVYSSPAIDSSGILYVGCWDFSVYALNAATGAWERGGCRGATRAVRLVLVWGCAGALGGVTAGPGAAVFAVG